MPIGLPSNIAKQTRNRHLLVWLLIIVHYAIFTYVEGNAFVRSTWILILIVNYSFSYYFLLFYIWPKVLDKREFIYILLIPLLLFLFFCIYYFQLQLMSHIGGSHPLASQPIFVIIQNNARLFFYVLIASIGSYYNWIGVKRIEDDIKIDKAIVETEFLFLKNQFHSHLTFNFLNFCFNKIRHVSYQTAASVEEFSNMLRYSLNSPAEGVVRLEQEVEYIENCISFQKCLSADNPNIHFNYEGDLKNTYILPRILVVFIENSLKHGELNDPQYPITIFIKSSQNKIFFNIINKKRSQIFKESGIGIQNVEQILELFYLNKHTLSVINNDNLFSCELQLDNLIK